VRDNHLTLGSSYSSQKIGASGAATTNGVGKRTNWFAAGNRKVRGEDLKTKLVNARKGAHHQPPKV